MPSPDDSNPPFYVLLAQSPLSNVSAGALSNTLAHPIIQYHYADDSPLSILPTQPNESVLVLNYDSESAPPTVQSISNNLVVNGLRVEEAPGAVADDSKTQRNISMFIIETTINDQYVRNCVILTLITFIFFHQYYGPRRS